MNANTRSPETFEAFKNSFFYGSRSNTNFKFLSHLSEKQASEFIQDLLIKLVEAYDSSDVTPVYEHIRQGQISSYAQREQAVYDTGPFCRLEKPLPSARLMLLTSSGHFVRGDDPKPLGVEDMTQEQAEKQIQSFLKEAPTLSVIPIDTPRERLVVRHGGYDVRGAKQDPGVSFPLDQLRLLWQDGLFAELVDPAYSFVGACSQTRLNKRVGPEWVRRFKEHQMDAALLVPV